MLSGFPGDFFNVNGLAVNDFGLGSVRMTNFIYNPQRSPLPGLLADSSTTGRPDLIGKRSFADFRNQQIQHAAALYPRNVKPRSYNQLTSPLTPMDFSISPEISSGSNISSPSSVSVPRYGVPVLQQNAQNLNFDAMITRQNRISPVFSHNLVMKQPPADQQTEKTMRNQLQELEKQLLLDDDDDGLSVVTDSEWSETIQNLLGANTPEVKVCTSPTTSASSSCTSSSVSPAATVSPEQLISDTATAIMDGKTNSAVEIITRLNQFSDARGTPKQRLTFYMETALRWRVYSPTTEKRSSPATELYSKEHVTSTQLLYDKSPCFKLAFMAANNTILEAVSGKKKIHVVDFDVGQGIQYVCLFHHMAAARENDKGNPISLTLTTFADFFNGGVESLKVVGDGLKMLSSRLGVRFNFNITNFKLSDLNNDVLTVGDDEVLAVNFAFKLYKLPDESVTTDNLRDEVLRRVKSLSPALVTVVEQEMNTNTASFTTRVNDACGYYGVLFDSLDSTLPSDSPERVRIEEGLSRRIVNSVVCEGRDRVERCELFGKWRARMKMVGFELKSPSHQNVESLLAKLNSGTGVNRGFVVKEYSGGIGIGWMGRNLTIASAWH